MDLYEYQGRDLFARHGLPVLDGGVATTPEEARAIAERLGGRVVVKAQVKVGGRGKAGGVKLAADADEAEARATDILGMDIKGHTVHKVMVTETADIVEEYYFSYLLDRANRTFLCIASVAGGMEIEQVAHEAPEKVAKVAIDANKGVDEATAREIVTTAGFPADVADQIADIAVQLWQTFVAEDALLVEVNPLAKVADGRVLLLDAKVTFDDNADVPAPGPRGAGGRRRRSIRWSSGPRSATSTTSSSTAPSASSATAPAWSCRRWTWSRTRARSSAGSARPTSSTSAAARRRR